MYRKNALVEKMDRVSRYILEGFAFLWVCVVFVLQNFTGSSIPDSQTQGVLLVYLVGPTVSLLMLVFLFFLSRSATKGAIRDAEKEEEKRQQIDRMVTAMEKASMAELSPAMVLLRGVGIYSDHAARGHNIHLPALFWEASPNLIATSLVTIVWGNGTVKEECLFQELSGIISARTWVSPKQAIKVAMLIQKKKPEAAEKLFV